MTALVDYLYDLHDNWSARGIVVFNNQPWTNTNSGTTWNNETAAQYDSVQAIMNCEGYAGIYFPVYFEGINEPDLNWGAGSDTDNDGDHDMNSNCGGDTDSDASAGTGRLSCSLSTAMAQAADYAVWDIWGGEASSNSSYAHYLLGVVGGSTENDTTMNYYYNTLTANTCGGVVCNSLLTWMGGRCMTTMT